MPSNNENTLERQKRKLQKVNRQKTGYDDRTTKYNERYNKLMGKNAHGVVAFSPESEFEEAQSRYNQELARQINAYGEMIDRAQAGRDDSKKRSKEAKDRMKEAERRHAAEQVMAGKAHGLILYDEKGNAYDSEGRRLAPAQVRRMLEEDGPGRSKRAMTVDSQKKADVVYPSNPTPEMVREYLKDPGRADIVGVDAPKGTRPTVNKRTTPSQAKQKAAKKRSKATAKKPGDETKASKRVPKKVEREMIGGEMPLVTEGRGRTYQGDRWGDYDNAGMMMASERSNPVYDGQYTEESCAGHRILRVYYDWITATFNVLAVKEGVPGKIVGRDYSPETGLWQGGTYNLNAAQIEDFFSGMRLVADYSGHGNASCRGKASGGK